MGFRRYDHKTLMQGIQMMIQGSITEAFAVRDGKEKEGNFAASMPTAPVAEGHLTGRGIIPPPSFSLTSPLAMPQHVLSRWPWVSEDTITKHSCKASK